MSRGNTSLPPSLFDYVANWRMKIYFSLSVNFYLATSTIMSPPGSKPVKPASDVKNIGIGYANGGKVCLNCLLTEDDRPLIITWAAFEHLQTVIDQKLKPNTGEAQSKLIMSVGLVTNTLTNIKCGQWLCSSCKGYKGGLEAELECLTKGTMRELGSVPIRILDAEDSSTTPPTFHDGFPHLDWLQPGYLCARDFSNFSSSWISLAHISTFLKAVASDSKKILGMRNDKAEWRLRIGSLSEYWSVTRSGCSEDLAINFSGLEKKIYRTGFQKLSNRGQDPQVVEAKMLKLTRSWIKGFSATDERDGAKFLHHNLNLLARFPWAYEEAKPALASLEKIISLETRQERVNRKRKLEGGISADNISGVILKDVRDINCFVRHTVQKIQHRQEWSEKALRSLLVKQDLIISLLKERSNGKKAAEVIQICDQPSGSEGAAAIINDQPSGSQGAAAVIEVVAGPSNCVRQPPSNSASSFGYISEDEPMDDGGDVLSNIVQAQGLEHVGLDAMDALRVEELNTPPLAHIDETLHRQVEDESRICDELLSEQEQEGDNVM